MSEKRHCSKSHYRHGWLTHCRIGATIERDGKWYCGIHDPVAVAGKSAKRANTYRERREAQDKLLAEAADRITKLGCGSPHYAVWEPTGGVTLSPEEADKLILQLSQMRKENDL